VKNIPHPVQYQGSKRNLAKSILRYFPKGVGRLIEPFAGSAAISIAAAAHAKAESFFLNDLNEPLSELVNNPALKDEACI
jgi:DNA adenine methylase